MTTDRLSDIEAEARAGLAGAADEAALEAWRTAVLGRSGTLTSVLRGLGALPEDERRAVGAAANTAKQALEAALDARRAELRRGALASMEALDVTLPGRPVRRGRLHPVTQVRREILDVFARLGFATVEGPEVELDEYNFGRLRIPEHHPARDMWDTFWLERESPSDAALDENSPAGGALDENSPAGGALDENSPAGGALDENSPAGGALDESSPAGGAMLLRTHTSPMQIRYIESHDPPIRIAVPGRCYRYEATDATHEWMMQQIELLAVDEGLSMANLKGTLQEFARQMFGPERRVLMRNSYFPFVEPGVELSVDCFACPGTDPACPVCRGSGWIEIMGAGMVHPEIIDAAGFDSKRYTGFAAGMGVERITMLKYGITDIRAFYSNDPRFLAQF